MKKNDRTDTIRQWQEKKRRNRWVVMVVFGGMLLLSLIFWWRGQKGELLKSEPVVWEKKELKVENGELKVERVDTSGLEEEIRGLVEGLEGEYVVYGKSLGELKVENGKLKKWEVEVGDADLVMQAASLIKVPVMVAAYRMGERGVVDLDSIYELREADRVGGSGSLMGKPEGYEVSLRKLIWHMGNESDNTAFAAVVNMVGEEKLEEEFLRMGLVKVSIKENEITPKEVGELFEGLYNYRWLSQENSEEILDSMVDTWYEDRIPAGINQSHEAGSRNQKVRIAHKVGTEVGVVGDAGIVFSDRGDYLLVIMSEGVREVEAKVVVSEISKVVWEWGEKVDNE